jgi:hypothetical protein
MIYLRGHLARPLDAAMSTASKVAVLRVLSGAGEMGRSGREVARLAGINHQSAATALAELSRLGLLKSSVRGRKTLWGLDRRRWLVSEVLAPSLEREAGHAEAVAAAIKGALKGRCRAAFVTGDAARGRLTPGRPLGLVAVESGSRRGLAEALRGLQRELAERYALELDARIETAGAAMRIAALEDAWRLLPDEGPGFISAAR